MKVYRVKSGDKIRYFDLTYDSPSLRRAIRRYCGFDCDFKVVNILNVRRYCVEDYRNIDAKAKQFCDEYGDLILMNDDLSECSQAYAVPHDSFTNREVQGGEPPAKCIRIPVDCPCIGCGECKN